MGNRSKSQEPGAFGSKKLAADGSGIVRPNRGRSRWKHGSVKSRGFRGFKIGEIVKKNAARAKAEAAVKSKEPAKGTGIVDSMKRVFQRKGA